MIEISIIIPSYKPKDYIYSCLDSLFNQTLDYKKYEIILILNGCDEPYSSNIKEYVKIKGSNHSFKFIQTDIGSVSNARNLGIDNSKGKYITFIDDDDYVSENYLKFLLLSADNNIISLSNVVAFNDTDKLINIEYSLSKLFLENKLVNINKARRYFGGPAMKLIHREIIGDCRFNTSFKNNEDALFMFTISKNIKKVRYTSNNAIYYRRIRRDSAFYSTKKISYLISDQFNLIYNYFVVYSQNIFKYNILFFITRILAAFKGLILKIKNNGR